MQSLALVWGASTYYFLSDSDNGYKVNSNCCSVFSGKISDPPFSELLLPYVLLSSFISTIHMQVRFAVVGLCHINLLPKLLGSSCESKKPLLRYHFHINVARVLVVEHLMWRQQLSLELLYRHAPVCLLVVLTFFFERLWKIVFVGKSLFLYLGLGYSRTELSSVQFPELTWSPLFSSHAIMGLGMGLKPNTKGGCISLGSMTPQKYLYFTLFSLIR